MGRYTEYSMAVEVTSILRGPAFGLPEGFVVMSIRPSWLDRDPDHVLKTWPEFYLEIMAGKKTFELRRDDRGFEVGDVLLLREYEPDDEERGRS